MVQWMVPLVDGTNFAEIESTITESDFNSGATRKFYGVNNGVSDAFTSGTVSKAGRLVRSGIFQITLKGSENAYDNMLLKVEKDGCAPQLFEWTNVDNDDSDILSALTVIQSMASDAASAAVQANSRVLLNQSRISDVYSALSDLQSDFQSRVPKRVATDSQLSNVHSDLASLMAGFPAFSAAISDVYSLVDEVLSHVNNGASMFDVLDLTSDVYSLLYDLNSNFNSRVPKEPAARSQLSDLASDIRSVLTLHTSTISDIRSALSDAHSDLASKIGGIAAAVSASDISDIASAVKAILASDMSDILSAAQQTNSRALVNQSRVSDVYSLLSDLDSNFGSRIPKEPAARSQLSDLASDLRSVLTLHTSTLSDIQSALSDAHSDLGSKIGGITVSLGASDISDIVSGIVAGGLASQMWSNSVRTLTAPASATTDVTGADITRTRAATWSIAITGLGDVSARSSPKLWFTIKSKLDGEDDRDALLQITETGGLLWLNGRSYGTPGHGSITVSDAAAGNITIAVDEDVTRQLKSANGLHYDIKMMASGSLTKLSQGKFTITNAVTLSIG